MKKIYIAVGCVSALIGFIGCVVPFLPTFPFFLLSAACFAKGSERLYEKLTSAKVYERNFKSFVNGEGMRVRTKIRIVLSVGIIVGTGFLFSDSIIVKIVLSAVFLFHLIYFVFIVKVKKD